ncbi:hypothetical protein [Bradyrhizobium sp. 199]|uniref:hypothetical protein n=1 Tax=Bradyrhizobium sp. 199 TaxID=2782664 RepID=UPI001FF8033C|nr:hypothetical protein [Bradyrhizobium sp. 199]MCK1361221.1 hypothetical protein [Bradyrhizobium sp. 199]
MPTKLNGRSGDHADDVDEHFGDDSNPEPFWRQVKPKDGLPLWEAMLFYGNQFDAEMAWSRRLDGFDGPPFYPFDEMSREEQREYNAGSMQFERARRQLESEIHGKLLRGELVATGYAADTPLDSPPTKILPDRWRLLEPDYRESTAKGGRLEISGILVFSGDRDIPKTLGAKRHSLAELRRWYSSWISSNRESGNAPSRDDDLEAARERFGEGVSRSTLRSLRKELAPDEWKLHGRRRER